MYESVTFYRQIETPSVVATPSGALDAATIAWAAAVVVNGGTVSAGRKTLVNNLIVGLRADGVWTKLDRLWLFAAENAASALTDIVADVLATAVNSPTFTADNGYESDQSTSYISSLFNPSTAGGSYVLNSAHISVWHYNTPPGICDPIGCLDGTSFAELAWDGASRKSVINSNNFDAGVADTGTTQHFLASRISVGGADLYDNGSVVNNGALASTALPNANLYILARNGNGPADNFMHVGDKLSMASIGGGLTATNVSNFYSRLRTYMTAVGVP